LSPSSINLYQYVLNDPINKWDPTGENPGILAAPAGAATLVAGGLFAAGSTILVLSPTARKEAKNLLDRSIRFLRRTAPKVPDIRDMGRKLENRNKPNPKKRIKPLPPTKAKPIEKNTDPKPDNDDKGRFRVRIQAQGEKLDVSVKNVDQSRPVTESEGIDMTEKLEASLSKKDSKIRQEAFENAKRFIKNAAAGGGVAPTKQSFPVKGTKHERVDVEVLEGINFVPDANPQ